MLRTVDHVIVAVRDLDAATARYQALLGRAPSWRGRHPDAGTANSLFRLANCYAELLAPAGEGPVGRLVEGALERSGEGLFGLCFGTDDIEAAVASLLDRGVAVEAPSDGEGRSEDSDRVRRWRTAFLPAQAARGLLLFAIEHTTPDELLPLAEPTGDEASCVRAVDHVVVHSPDLEASRALYGDTLGLRLALDRSFEARGLRMLFFRVGGVTLEVVGSLSAEPAASDPDRFGGLAYQVRDADAAQRRLAAEGFDVSGVRDGNKPGTRVCTVRDGTCGVPTLIIQPV